ncbi:eukaryotic translation initiation factor 4E-binding protein 2 isoform 1-T1 [Erethizon dorsatum]
MSSSAGSGHQPSQSRAIPTRTVPISDAAQLPHDYCTTPGGTLFSTTPGGTRIIYDRKFLLDRRNSPMAQTPPCHLPNIPGVTSPGTLIEDSKVEVNNLNNLNNHDRKHAVAGDDSQFEMDI